MNFNNYKIRCSSLDALLTKPENELTTLQLATVEKYKIKTDITEKQKAELTKLLEKQRGPSLSLTAKAMLIGVFLKVVYNREKIVSNKFLEKGNSEEELSIGLVNKLLKKNYIKNEQHYENDYIKGTPDAITPDGLDVKTCWDIHSFKKKSMNSAEKNYGDQMRGYMQLVGADEWKLAYTLVNTPEHLIVAEKNKIMNMSGLFGQEGTITYVDLEERIEREMKFDDIPAYKRMKLYTFKHSNEWWDKVQEKVIDARVYLNSLDL